MGQVAWELKNGHLGLRLRLGLIPGNLELRLGYGPILKNLGLKLVLGLIPGNLG